MSATAEVLTFPPIDVEPPRSAVALAAGATLGLQQFDLTDLAVAQFGDWRAAVTAARARLVNVAHDVSTQAKIDEAKTLRFALIGRPRADVRKLSKDLKSKLTAVAKRVSAEEDVVVAAWDELEPLITPQIDAGQHKLDTERAERQRQKEEAARAEAERRQRLEDGLNTIAGYVARASGKTAAEMSRGIAFVRGIVIDAAHWQEFTERATSTLADTLAALDALHARQVKAEAEAAELAALRAEKQERDRQAEQRRQEAAAAAAEAERQAAQAPKAAETAPNSEVHPPPQQVLKAEPATADATDRGMGADASPRGGAMGAGQAAAAAPAGEIMLHARAAAGQIAPHAEATPSNAQAIIRAEPATENTLALLEAALALAQHAQAAFTGRFPSQPKMGAAWWEALRQAAQELEPRLQAVLAGAVR